MRTYDHTKIESKWQRKWATSGIYRSKETPQKQKAYVLDMFPYPSGEGLHVGHPKGYIATDIFSRQARMNGKSVLHPMGWDAFGLPAENYAIKNKIHPRKAVEKNIKRFKKQLQLIGLDYDWAREIHTTDPSYYKWTQWIFLKLYERGLAYQSYEPINWCPSCQTGLANEDLEGNTCERCGTVVEKRPMRQWILRITKYAERLLQDLELLPEWQEHIKESQRNWIGRSEGAEIDFPIEFADDRKYTYVILHGWKGTPNAPRYQFWKQELEAMGHRVIIPTLPNTAHPREDEQVKAALESADYGENTVLFGHSLGCAVAMKVVEKLQRPIARLVLAGGFADRNFQDKNRPFEKSFVWKFDGKKIRENTRTIQLLHDPNDHAISEGQVKRLEELLHVKAVRVEGEKSHFTGEKERSVLMWLRPTIRVFTTRPDTLYGATFLILSPEHPWLLTALQKHLGLIKNEGNVGRYIALSGQKSEIERQENKEKTGVKLEGPEAINPATGEKIPLYVADYVLATYGTGAIMAVPAHDTRDYEFAKKCNLPIREVISGGDISKEAFVGDGTLVNSGTYNGMTVSEAKQKIGEAFGLTKITYKLRDWVFSRQRYWGEPIPIIHCEQCGVVPVPEEDLPVRLPNVRKYAPTGTGESPLATIEKWVNVKCPKCKGNAKRETNTMPQWAGSSWYYLRYMDPKNKRALVDKKKEKYWAPVDLYVGGAEHATRHLIYARFWHKFLCDIGSVSTQEPFARLISVGLILAEDGKKMSKRHGNVINPDDIIRTYGADTLRVYEMFMGPFTDSIAWKTSSLIGARRFLERVWKLAHVDFVRPNHGNVERIVHQTIKKVTEDIRNFKFNTAISQMMICVNEAEKGGMTAAQFQIFLKLLAPFAPHIAEELWSSLGNKKSIHAEVWPTHDERLLKADIVTIAVQVNGKMRGTVSVPVDSDEKEVQNIAEREKSIVKHLAEHRIAKVFYVKNRLLNFVLAK